MVVEHMDRAQGPTVDFFPQTLPGTLSTTAKLTSLTVGSTRYVHVSDRRMNTQRSICEPSLLYQLGYGIAQARRSKTRTGKGHLARKRHSRTLSLVNRATTAAAQRESHHAVLHHCSTSMQARVVMEWSVSQARTSSGSRELHTCQHALKPCMTTSSAVQCARTKSTNSCRISSSPSPQIAGRTATQAAPTIVSDGGGSSRPRVSRRHGRRGRRRPSKATQPAT